MRHHTEPVIGDWYNSKNFAESFVVVDCDKDDCIEIQYLDGVLDKIDFDTWDSIDVEEIPEPGDATAPYGIELEDDMHNLLNEIEEQEELENVHFMDSDEERWD